MAITKAATDDAEKKINVAAMKYLFELIGLYPVVVEEKKDNEQPDFSETLLRELGLPTEPILDEEKTKQREQGGIDDLRVT